MYSLNFAFLEKDWPVLAELGALAESYVYSDPASSCVKCRILAENIAKLVAKVCKLPITEYNTFNDILRILKERPIIESKIFNLFYIIKDEGNNSAHEATKRSEDAIEVVNATFEIARWLYRQQKRDIKAGPRVFLTPKPQAKPISPKELEEIKALAAANEEALKAANTKLLEENAELLNKFNKLSKEQQERELQAVADTMQQATDMLQLDEAETRKRLIDTMLGRAGWDIHNPDAVALELELPIKSSPSGKGRADYVLYDDNGTAIAVIEAKRTSKDPKVGREQAREYADALQRQNPDNIRPLILLTNGHEIILVDDKGGPQDLPVKGYADRRIYGYPAKDSLSYRTCYQQKTMVNPSAIAHNPNIIGGGGRTYQVEAVKAVTEGFGEQRRRKALIVQATGTGKTRVAVALVDILIRANFAKRVLFLCDRVELCNQAKKAFTDLLPNINASLFTKEKNSASSVVITTYQSMINQLTDYDVAWFDLIIADESHRSIYNKYREIFLYFDALHLGLTATPRKLADHHTYNMFDCKEGDPTYFYEYDSAIKEGNLVDFTPIAVSTKFSREGIHAGTVDEKEIQRFEKDGLDFEELDGDPQHLDKQTYNEHTNELLLQNLMENGLRDTSENGPGKTIIFARNHHHAELLGKLFQKNYPEYGPNYCAVIDNYESRASSLIDQFKEPFSNPIIAISVDMLDTGIDVPQILNLVFAKPIKSHVKFWQMIGRGTRLCPDLLGHGEDKKGFYIFDHWRNFEYFEEERQEREAAPSMTVMERLFRTRLDLAELSLEKMDKASFDRTIALVRAMITALPDDNLAVSEKYKIKYQSLEGDYLERFDAHLVTILRTDLAPLMRHISIGGDKAAYNFDLLMTQAQKEFLQGSILLEGTKAEVENLLANMTKNALPVQDKFNDIKGLQAKNFWEQKQEELLPALEEKRLALRGIIKYSTPAKPKSSLKPNDVNFTDGDVYVEGCAKVRPSAKQMREYHARVRDVLEPHFESNPVLLKVRRGEALTESDFDTLVALALAHNADVNIADLREFYPALPELERELRSIIGLDAGMVTEHFVEFFQRYPNLTPLQVRFLDLLQKQIAKYGPMQIQKLYEAPFISMSSQGPDGIFEEAQVDDLQSILQFFTKLGTPSQGESSTL